MNNIKTSDIVDPNRAMPFLGPTLDFLQGMTKDMINAIMQNFLARSGFTYSTSTVYILSGCINASVLPTYNISAGYVYFNGEVYRCPAVSGTVSGGNTLYSAVDVTNATTLNPDPVTGVTPDPVEFSDGALFSVHEIRNWKIQQLTTGSGANAFSTFINLVRTRDHQVMQVATILIDSYYTGGFVFLKTGSTDVKFTTPNDGITRRYMITAKILVDNGALASNADYAQFRIYDFTGSAELDHSAAGKAQTQSVSMYQTLTMQRTVDLAPNKTVGFQCYSFAGANMNGQYILFEMTEI